MGCFLFCIFVDYISSDLFDIVIFEKKGFNICLNEEWWKILFVVLFMYYRVEVVIIDLVIIRKWLWYKI